MQTQNDLLRVNGLDLSSEIITVNPIATPLTSLLYDRGQTKTAKDVFINQKTKTLSTGTPSGGRKDGADAPAFEISQYDYVKNYLEIFSKATAVSGTAGAVQGGTQAVLAEQIADRLLEMKGDMEYAFFNGVQKAEDGVSGRKTSGLINQVGHTVDVGALALTQDHILDALQAMFTAGAVDGELFIFANPTVKRLINKLFVDAEKAQINLQAGSQGVGIAINKIYTDFGLVNLVMANAMQPGNILVTNLNHVEIHELQGRKPKFEALAKTGDAEKGQVVTESGIILANPNAGAKIINFV